MSNKENNILITSTDLIILNTLLYIYGKTKKPVTIPDIEKLTKIRYTTIRYSINKFKKLGILEEKKIQKGGTQITGYEPYLDIIFVFDKNYILVILKDIVVPIYLPDIDISSYIGKKIPIKEAPPELSQVINALQENLEFMIEYGFTLKKEYLNLLFQQYLEQRKKLYS